MDADVDFGPGSGLDAGIGLGAHVRSIADFDPVIGLRAELVEDFDDVDGGVRDEAFVFDAVAVLSALIFSVCVVAPFAEWRGVFDANGV